MQQWIRFEDRKPKTGMFVLMVGGDGSGKDWLWWGYYNPKKKDGMPMDVADFWHKISPFPTIRKEVIDGQVDQKRQEEN